MHFVLTFHFYDVNAGLCLSRILCHASAIVVIVLERGDITDTGTLCVTLYCFLHIPLAHFIF